MVVEDATIRLVNPIAGKGPFTSGIASPPEEQRVMLTQVLANDPERIISTGRAVGH
jgi:hypothetical protein